jgi:hypothetical protein
MASAVNGWHSRLIKMVLEREDALRADPDLEGRGSAQELYFLIKRLESTAPGKPCLSICGLSGCAARHAECASPRAGGRVVALTVVSSHPWQR